MNKKTTISGIEIPIKKIFDDDKNKRSGKELRRITSNEELKILLKRGKI